MPTAPSTQSSKGTCYLEWSSWALDGKEGLNHQFASLSCALNEAYALQRTLLLPEGGICDSHAMTQKNGGVVWSNATCIPWHRLLDLELLSAIVPVQEDRLDEDVPTVEVGRDMSTAMIKATVPCTPQSRLLRRIRRGYWFRMCSDHMGVDHLALPRKLSQLGRNPFILQFEGVHFSGNDLLRSGLWFARTIKQVAIHIQAELSRHTGSYVSVHVRRGDRCKSVRCDAGCDQLTRPDAMQRALALWFPHGTHLFVGSDEKPSFFGPMHLERGGMFRLHFAEDYQWLLRQHNLTHGLEMYMVDTLVKYGALAHVETYSFYHGSLGSCFPAYAFPARKGVAHTHRRAEYPEQGRVLRVEYGEHGGAHQGRQKLSFPSVLETMSNPGLAVTCKHRAADFPHEYTMVNGVHYGPACINNEPCGKKMHFHPEPKRCKFLENITKSTRHPRSRCLPHVQRSTTSTRAYAHALKHNQHMIVRAPRAPSQ